MEKAKCPYCGKENKIDHEDGYGYEEDVKYQQTCNQCNKVFGYETIITRHYDVFAMDCQNEGGECHWQPSATFPKEFTVMMCSICGAERELTEEERVFLGIGIKEEYLDRINKSIW